MNRFARCCASSLVFMFLAAPAGALVTFGLHGGLDFNQQDAVTLEAVDLDGGGELSLDRAQVDNPLLLGVHAFVDIVPLIDVELGVEGSTSRYDVSYELSPGGNSYSEELRFWRLGAYASGKFNLISLPALRGYVGGGVGYHLVSELVSRDLIADTVASGGDLEPKDLVERQGSAGVHLLAGARIDPAVLPVALSLELRYTMLQENDFGDETNKFASLVLGFDLGF